MLARLHRVDHQHAIPAGQLVQQVEAGEGGALRDDPGLGTGDSGLGARDSGLEIRFDRWNTLQSVSTRPANSVIARGCRYRGTAPGLAARRLAVRRPRTRFCVLSPRAPSPESQSHTSHTPNLDLRSTTSTTSPRALRIVAFSGMWPGSECVAQPEARIVGAEGHLDLVQQALGDLAALDQALGGAVSTLMAMRAALLPVATIMLAIVMQAALVGLVVVEQRAARGFDDADAFRRARWSGRAARPGW
ncbi:MAG: hypothetical protein MZV64_27995 [Ignavibacteriales bacterium]|nr:hypothetical protein [Ignavibacteriales bacterium]